MPPPELRSLNRTGPIRQTEPSPFNPYAGNGGFTIIPRRIIGSDAIRSGHGLQGFAVDYPLRLLSLLPDLHPSVGLALWNAIRLTCAPSDLRIVAIKETAGAGTEATDDAGTAAIDELWLSQPAEIGGLVGLQTQLMQEAILKGLLCVEAVPAGRMKGLWRVIPVDSLSIAFHRDPVTDEMLPAQRQMQWRGERKETFQGYVELNRATFFWRSIDSMVDEPYGRAPYAPALCEALADIALTIDLRDALHNGAWPRMGIGFAFEEMYRVAKEVFNLKEPEASEWVKQRFNDTVTAVANLKPEDNLFYDSAGELVPIEGGKGLAAVGAILEYLRQRMVQALKTLPTLMGINDGSTQTYTNVEWQIYSAGLESLREAVTEVLVKCAQLHLQLLGLPLRAMAKVKSIRTTDALVEAQTEQIQIANSKEKIRLGWITNEEAAVSITGSGCVAQPMLGAFDRTPAKNDPKPSEQVNP